MTIQRWTLADVKQANNDAGGCFFSRDSMKFFGDTMRSFAVRHVGGEVFIDRIRPMRDRAGRSMGGVGSRRLFNPSTGRIGPVLPRD